MREELRGCWSCAFFECIDTDGEFLDTGFCMIQELYTFVEDDDICDEYILDKEVEKDIESGVFE